jgi:glutamyl-tRNA reductase
MQLLCLSVSHHNTPVELRECLSLPADKLDAAGLKCPLRTGRFEAIQEMAVLSTCNRLEIYALVTPPEDAAGILMPAFQPILDYLNEVFEIPIRRIEALFRPYLGSQVVEHLFQVAAGLDSIAIGETQILGQVSRALDIALRTGSVRHVLSTLFRSAIHAGKRVRTETAIGRTPTSIASIAVQLAEAALGSLAAHRVLVVGAGKVAGHTLSALRECGAHQITLTNRTHQHALDLAQQCGASVLPYERRQAGLVNADLVFTAAAVSAPVIRRDEVAEAMSGRAQRPLTMFDLSVPRNVEAAVREIPNVKLFDMDDLQAYVKQAEFDNRSDIALAKTIVAAEAAEYEKLLRVIPFIGELHKKVEIIRQREVERALRNLRNPDPQVGEQFELFSRALVRKILHEPTMHLRTESDQETLNDYVDTLARLFDISETEADLV